MDKTVTEILESIRGAISGVFATKDSLQEASEYCKSLLKSTAPEQVETMTGMALAIYHNTLANEFGKMAGSIVEKNYQWLPSDESDQHEVFTLELWKSEVENSCTLDSYVSWVNELLAKEEDSHANTPEDS